MHCDDCLPDRCAWVLIAYIQNKFSRTSNLKKKKLILYILRLSSETKLNSLVSFPKQDEIHRDNVNIWIVLISVWFIGLNTSFFAMSNSQINNWPISTRIFHAIFILLFNFTYSISVYTHQTCTSYNRILHIDMKNSTEYFQRAETNTRDEIPWCLKILYSNHNTKLGR